MMLSGAIRRQWVLYLLAFMAMLVSALSTNPVLAAPADGGIDVEINKGQMIRLDRTAHSIMVADPGIADVQVISPRLVYVQGKKVGETSIFAIDAHDTTILNTVVNVTHNISKMQSALKQVMPDANIEFSTIDGGLMMRGDVASPMEAESIKNLASSFIGAQEKLINMLNVEGSDQIMLQVKVAEVSRNDLKRFGVNMQHLISPGNFNFQVLQGRSFLTGAGALTRSGTDNSIFGRFVDGGTSASAVVDALETQGLITVLAEPSLTTTSGKKANFLAGGEYPVPSVDSEGAVTISYKTFGVSLDFTPTLLSRDKISLTVTPEVSTVAEVNTLQAGTSVSFPVPTLQTRRATTTVELGSGQSFAIAGLLKNDRNNSVQKFPGLGELPVLGALFRSQQFRNDQSELVILVTPYIVRPASQKLATPLDGYVPASDIERIFKGKLYHETPAGGDVPAPNDVSPSASAEAPRLNGEAGFLMEP